jgi:hypothetical protein
MTRAASGGRRAASSRRPLHDCLSVASKGALPADLVATVEATLRDEEGRT